MLHGLAVAHVLHIPIDTLFSPLSVRQTNRHHKLVSSPRIDLASKVIGLAVSCIQLLGIILVYVCVEI